MITTDGFGLFLEAFGVPLDLLEEVVVRSFEFEGD